MPKKKDIAQEEEEDEDDAAKVAPTLRGWKKRKAQNEVQTLVLIALMFAVPITVLEVFVANAQSESIAFARKELDGYRFAGPILAAASALSLHSGLATQLLSGDAGVQTRMERAARRGHRSAERCAGAGRRPREVPPAGPVRAARPRAGTRSTPM